MSASARRSQLKPLVQAELQQDRGRQRLRLQPAAVARRSGRPAGADGDQLDRRLPGRLRADGEAEGCRAQERPVHRLRQRSRLQPAGGAGQDRPLQGERSRHHHAAGRQYAGDAARRQLRQPLQSRGAILSGDSAGAARQAAVAGIARRILRADQHRPAGAAVDHRLDRDRHRSEFADALQPAQLRDLPGGADAGRDGRRRRSTSSRARPRSCRPASATTISPTPGNMCRKATSSRSPSALR